jgi:hypothetical protein
MKQGDQSVFSPRDNMIVWLLVDFLLNRNIFYHHSTVMLVSL